MKAEATITKEKIVFGNDSIVIRKHIDGIKGGRALDCTGFAPEVINAGHIVIKKSNGDYAPMPVADNAYAALPEGATYVGVTTSSVATKNAAVGIMTNGVVNSELIPYSMTTILDAFKVACPHITFEKDEEA